MKQFPINPNLEARLSSMMPPIPMVDIQFERVEYIQEQIFQLARKLAKVTPHGREQDKALDKLEEACLLYKLAIQKDV
jgi:hypothetical protein